MKSIYRHRFIVYGAKMAADKTRHTKYTQTYED